MTKHGIDKEPCDHLFFELQINTGERSICDAPNAYLAKLLRSLADEIEHVENRNLHEPIPGASGYAMVGYVRCVREQFDDIPY